MRQLSEARMRVTHGVNDLRQACADGCGCRLVELRERHHRLDRWMLLADQAVKTPTKPAVVQDAIASSEINTRAPLVCRRRHHRSGRRARCATLFSQLRFPTPANRAGMASLTT